MANLGHPHMVFHIVDDCCEIRDLLEIFIKDAGYESEMFASAEVYLDYLHSSEFVAPVAIIFDYKMRGINGFQMIRKVREILPNQQAVISSGLDDVALNNLMKPTYCHTLSKPYEYEALFSLLDKLVDHLKNT